MAYFCFSGFLDFVQGDAPTWAVAVQSLIAELYNLAVDHCKEVPPALFPPAPDSLRLTSAPPSLHSFPGCVIRHRSQVWCNGPFYDLRLQQKVAMDLQPALAAPSAPETLTLSPREREVLDGLAEGQAYKQIADKLGDVRFAGVPGAHEPAAVGPEKSVKTPAAAVHLRNRRQGNLHKDAVGLPRHKNFNPG